MQEVFPLSRYGSVTTRLWMPPASIHYRVAASLPQGEGILSRHPPTMWGPYPTTESKENAPSISKAPHFPHPYPPNKSLIGTSKSPEALRRGGGVPGVPTQNTLLPPTAASVTMRGIPKGDPSPLGGVLLELFCRRGQKSGKVRAMGYEMGKTFWKKVFPRPLLKTFNKKGLDQVIGHPIAKGERLTRRGMSTGQNFGSSADHVGPLPHN